MDTNNEFFITYFLILLISIIYFSILVARQGEKKGYSYLKWFIVSFCFIPIAFLYLLAELPNRKIDFKREEEMKLLEEQLSKTNRTKKASSSETIAAETISDEITIQSRNNNL